MYLDTMERDKEKKSESSSDWSPLNFIQYNFPRRDQLHRQAIFTTFAENLIPQSELPSHFFPMEKNTVLKV